MSFGWTLERVRVLRWNSLRPFFLPAVAIAMAVLVLLSPGSERVASANAATFSLNKTSFGPNEEIRVVVGSLTRDSSDFIWTFSSIYIVPAGTVTSGGDLNDVSGAPNSVMGISGTGIVDELIGITAPGGNIGTGTYVVIEDANQDAKFTGVDSVGPEFTVTVPANVPPLPNDPYAQMKARAANLQEKLEEVHAAYEAFFAVAEVLSIYDAFRDPHNMAVYMLGKTQSGIYNVQAATLQTILSVAAKYEGIAADPPDPSFAQPTSLSPTAAFDYESSDSTQQALELLGNALVQENALAEALLASLERYQGADIAGDGEWALAQARDIKRYAELMATNGAASSAAAASLSDALNADTRDYTAASFDMQSIANGVGTSGFDADEYRDLRNLEFTDVEISNLADLVAGQNWSFTTSSFQTLIGQLATEYSGLDSALSELVNGIDGVIDALESDPGVVGTVPTADAGGPYFGSEGDTLNLDATASVPGPSGAPITTYEWDTDGDGLFDDATGSTPSVMFEQARSGYVGVLVTDGNGISAVDYALLGISDVNFPPTIDASTPILGFVELSIGGTQPFSVTATDPDGDVVSVDWELDGTPVGTGATFDYSPVAGDEGPHNLIATVSDDSPQGGQTRRLWLVHVNNTDDDLDLWNANVDCDDADPTVNPGATEVIGNGINDDCSDATPDSGTPPMASFTTIPQFGEPGVNVKFTSTSTDPDDAIVGYEWDFDNNGGGDAFTGVAFKSFPATGTYPVTLTVTDDAGNSDSITLDFLVAEAPTASFDVAAGPRVAGFDTGFIDTSSDPNGSIVSWEWDFGDGGASNQQNPFHIFGAPGIYQVSLMVTDDEGAYDSTSQSLTVGSLSIDAGQDRFIDEGNVAEFSQIPGTVPNYVPDSNVVQFPVAQFLGTGAGPGTTASIDWGEGAGPEAATVGFTDDIGLVSGSHLYQENGVFDVVFCITTPAPGSSTACDSVVVTVNNVAPVSSLFDLSSWTPESYAPVSGFPVGKWRVAEDRRSVSQVNNGQPTYFASDFDVFESESTVRIQVPGGDDDMIGFALGFIPGDTSNPNADYILVDWKAGSQSHNFSGNTANCTPGVRAPRGLAVSRVTGIPTADELWGHVNFTRDNSSYDTTTEECLDVEDAGVEQLARGATLGSTGWRRGVEYRFDFEYTATNLKIWVDGVLEFDIDGAFPNGRLGFYNFSQAGVTYSALGVSSIGAFEGAPITILGDYQDPGVLDTHTGTMYWADGSPLDVLTLTPDATTPSNGLLETPVHVFEDNGTFITQACVEDDDGGRGCKQVTVNVSNLPPTVLASDNTVPAGQPAETQVQFTDPGADDVHSAVIDWGDGSPVEQLGEVVSPIAPTHVYSTPGIYTVTVTVTDDDGGEGIAQATITVEEAQELPPVADAGGPYEVDEGSTVLLDGSGSSDPDGDIVSYEWDLDGDGAFGENGTAAENGDETGVAPTFDASGVDGPAVIEVALRVTDDSDLSNESSASITVNNIGPSVTAVGDAINEGGTATVSGTINDPGAADTFSLEIDWGDGSPVTPFSLAAGSTSYSVSHVYADDNPPGTASDDYAVTVAVTDDDDGTGTAETTVTVNNVAPAPNAGGPYVVDEGGSVVLAGTSADPGGAGDPAAFEWDLDNDGTFETSGQNPLFDTSGIVAPAVFTITLRVTDDDSGVGTDGTTVTVREPAPTPVDALSPAAIPVAEGRIIAAGTGLIAQPGSIEITVPDGASIEQVLLYWEGQFTTGSTGDSAIEVDGVEVTGASIGGPTTFFSSNDSETFRADITQLGLVSTGNNSIAVSGMDNSRANNGAGIVVIYSDGAETHTEIRDGNDLAFINFAPPLDTTVPQTFEFEPADGERIATLSLFFSSVAGTISGAGSDRPSSIEITTGGVTTVLSNELASIDSDEWDTLNIKVIVPAGATSLTVQAFSRDDLNNGNVPASFTWNMAAFSLPVLVTDIEPLGLVAHWSFDEGTGADSSGNGNDTAINGAEPVFGRVDAGALRFDGEDDYAAAGSTGIAGSALSLTGWVNADDLSNCRSWDCRIASQATGTAEQDHYLMLSTIKVGDEARLRFRLKTDGHTTTLIAHSGALQNGAWHHVAAVYDGSTMRLYLDGVEVGSTVRSGEVDSNPLVPLWIGGNPDDPASRPWAGRIDEVKLYDVALAPTTVNAEASVPPQSQGLIAHWTFDDGTGTDSSGNGNDTTVNGASISAGQVGAGALDFDGVDDYADAGSLDITGEALTLTAWVKSDNLANCGASDCRIASMATGTAEQDHHIMLSTISTSTGVKLRFRLKAGGSTTTLIADTGNLSDGTWHYVAAVYDGSTMRLYLDGAEAGTTTRTGNVNTSSSVALWIGGNPDDPTSRPWDGRIDEVKVYDVVLPEFR